TKELVELMGFFLSTQISNHLMMNQLEALSKVDTLTDIYNRNEMSEMVKNLEGRPFGLINLDLNGLKAVNDNYGHTEGDKLLIKASNLLKSVFRKSDVYRAGGDEFMVILPDMPEELFHRKVETLKEAMEKDDSVSLAMGAVYSDGTKNIHDIFVRSDELMYEDKKRIYKQRPDLIRKNS
ncbi:MAG: GGDEF domain-containing protein, partial [Erysipelotrichaceae bacterium]|nr:GGDEF domain-containing protein [Erysipelotrichaceae bacterium]